VKAITTGAFHTCALTTSGGVRCWGSNEHGQLGDGTTVDRSSPPSTDVLTGVKAIDAGYAHTCALMTTGGVRCWGYNFSGQTGDGTTVDQPSPPANDVLTGVQAIAAQGFHTCALMISGGARCWGYNVDGELGNGTTELYNAVPPTTDVLTGVKAMAGTYVNTCALTNTGGVRCWGSTYWGMLGPLGTEESPAPDTWSTPPGWDVLTGVQTISCGETHACALMETGSVRCWGQNACGKLGDGDLDIAHYDTPHPIPATVVCDLSASRLGLPRCEPSANDASKYPCLSCDPLPDGGTGGCLAPSTTGCGQTDSRSLLRYPVNCSIYYSEMNTAYPNQHRSANCSGDGTWGCSL